MPFQVDPGGPFHIDASELGAVPGMSRWTLRRLVLAERLPPPTPGPPRAWPLEVVAGVMRDMALPLPHEWGLPLEGEGGLDLGRWVGRLPAGVPMRASAILKRWLADGGAEVRPLDFGRGLEVLCRDGGSLCRWKSDGGWLYMRGVRPIRGRRARRRRAGDWRGFTTA